MAFSPVFGRTFRATFDPRAAAAAVTPWYLSGGIASANCIAAFLAKGAADYATSKVNLASGGATWNAADGAAYPTWAGATGWTFASASSQYLVVGSGAICSGTPLSMIALAQEVSGNYPVVMSICDTGASARFQMFFADAAGDVIMLQSVAGGTTGTASTTTTFSKNTWHVIASVTSAVNSRAAYLDAAGKGTNATSATPSGLDTTYIGCDHNGTGLENFHNGKIGACAFYNIALSDAQVAALTTAMNLL